MTIIKNLSFFIFVFAFIYISSSYGMPGETEEEVVVRDFSSRDAYTYAPHPIDDKLIHDRETGAIYLLPHTPTDVQHTEAGGKVDMPGKASAIDSDPEAVLGQLFRDKDGREPVLFPAQNPLYRIHAQVNIMVAQGSYGGSGTLVGPHHLLTAGHNLYDQKYGGDGWARSISVRCATADCSNPFGEQRVIRAYTYRRWVDFLDKEFDLALFILDKPIGLNIGWSGLAYLPQMPKRHHELDGEFYVAGYPQTVKRTRFPDSETKKGEEFETMWRMSNRNEMGEIQRVRINPLTLSYPIDTSGGQSGSSLWYARGEAKAPEPYTVGVHAYGGAGTNSATRITKDRFTQIMQWISETYHATRRFLSFGADETKADEIFQKEKKKLKGKNRKDNSSLVVPAFTILEYQLPRNNRINLIEENFRQQKSGDGIPCVVIRGIGGSGKTILSQLYAQKQNAELVAIIDSQSNDTCFASFLNLAETMIQNEDDRKKYMGLVEEDNKEKAILYLMSFISSHINGFDKWILIFDNLNNNNVLKAFYPKINWGSGRVLITTRSDYIGSKANSVNILTLSEYESLELLQNILKLKGCKVRDEKELDSDLLKLLPPFPLDITLAAYYISTVNISLLDYLNKQDRNGRIFRDLLEEFAKEENNTGYQKTRYHIISTSILEILGEHPELGPLLFFFSSLYHKYVPLKMLINYINKETIDPDILDLFIVQMKKYSLLFLEENVSNNQSEGMASVHESTQQNMHICLDGIYAPEKKSIFISNSAEVLESFMADVATREDISLMALFIKHGERFLSFNRLLDWLSESRVSCQVGDVYRCLGNYNKAVELCRKGYKLFKRHGTVENWQQHALTLSYLGNCLRKSGDYTKSKKYLERSLSIYNNYQELNAIARTMAYLGSAQSYLGNYDTSIEIFERSLGYYRSGDTSCDMGVAWVYGHLGRAYTYIGNFTLAKKYLKKGLKIYTTYENHLRIAWAIANLGNVYSKIGNYEKARRCLEKSLSIFEDSYSKGHLNIAWVQCHLGFTYGQLKDHKKSIEYCEKSNSIFKEIYGEHHIQTAWTFFRLGAVYVLANQYTIGERLFHQVHQIFTNHYGAKSNEIAEVYRYLGIRYYLEEKIEDADKYLTKSRDILKENNSYMLYFLLEDLANLNLKKSLALRPGKELSEIRTESLQYLEEALLLVRNHCSEKSPHFLRLQLLLMEMHNDH